MDVDIIKSTLQFHNQMETLALTRIHVALCEMSNDLIIYEFQVHHWEFMCHKLIERPKVSIRDSRI